MGARRNTGAGILFPNEKKVQPAQPDFTGTFKDNAPCPNCHKPVMRRYRVAQWWVPSLKDPKKKVLSLAAEPRESDREVARPKREDW